MHAGRGWRRLAVHGAPLSRVSCALSADSWRSGTAFSSSGLSNAGAQPAPPSPSLRIGVLGLGAIGTIFFAKLGLLATSAVHGELQPLPALAVDALVKPEQLRGWLEANSRDRRLAMTVHHQDPATATSDAEAASVLRFTADRQSSKQLAVACDAPNVRVRTLPREGESQTDDERLDVLLVAVKAYDSAHVLQELREKHAHLLREDALCVLLQNGLGELPAKEEVNAQRGPAAGSHWPLLNGVTFVGGRVLSFGNVLASGLDAGTTYLAPLAASSMASKGPADSKTGSQHQNDQDTKMKLLTQVLLAAGLRCELLGSSEMQAMLWRKLIVNAAINPLASLLDAPNKASTMRPNVGNSEGSRQCVNLVVQEALAVAQCEQIPLQCTHEELVNDILDVARNTGSNVCSMLADLRRGSRTEIDAITGKIVAGGKRHGIPTPTNALLLSLINALEEEGTRRMP